MSEEKKLKPYADLLADFERLSIGREYNDTLNAASHLLLRVISESGEYEKAISGLETLIVHVQNMKNGG